MSQTTTTNGENGNGKHFTLRGPAWVLITIISAIGGAGAGIKFSPNNDEAADLEIERRLTKLEAQVSTNEKSIEDLETPGNPKVVMSITSASKFQEAERRMQEIERRIIILEDKSLHKSDYRNPL